MSTVKNRPVQGRSADLHLRSPSPRDEHCYKHQIIFCAFTQTELDCCFSAAESCLTLCDPMDFPVFHCFPEFAQTHVHWVGDATQPSHPLSSPSPPAFSLSQHQGVFPMSQFFESGSQSIGALVLASVLPINIQDGFPLEWTGWISLQSKGLSRVFSNTTVQKHQFFGNPWSLQSYFYY